MDNEKKSWHVYILLCTNGAYYVGMSTDVESRFQQHKNSRGALFTKKNPPIKILWQEAHLSENSARQRELQIKRWSRKKKEALISRII